LTKSSCTSDQALSDGMFPLTSGRSLTKQGPSHRWGI